MHEWNPNAKLGSQGPREPDQGSQATLGRSSAAFTKKAQGTPPRPAIPQKATSAKSGPAPRDKGTTRLFDAPSRHEVKQGAQQTFDCPSDSWINSGRQEHNTSPIARAALHHSLRTLKEIHVNIDCERDSMDKIRPSHDIERLQIIQEKERLVRKVAKNKAFKEANLLASREDDKMITRETEAYFDHC
jgi:hypothetical protein